MPPSPARDYLLTLPRFTDQGAVAYQPGLERMQQLMEAMGRPHRAFKSVHVAGTNGKGSTASLIAAIATTGGRRTGLHTSPHLFDLGERMRVDGAPAAPAWLDGTVVRFRPLFEEVRPSFFEATVALSFLYFAEQQVDLAIVEVGLGGRLDATNIIFPELAVITTIGLEHTELLGDTLGQIAREKAGIIKPTVPVLTAVRQEEALAAIRAVAAERSAPLHVVQDEVAILESGQDLNGLRLHIRTPVRNYDNLAVGLAGSYQRWNAALALRAAELLFDEVGHDSSSVYVGMAQVRARSGIRGRLDVLQARPLVVADVGHNADGLAATLETLAPYLDTSGGALFVLFGVMRDKDVGRMAGLLVSVRARVFAVSVASDRALPASELATILSHAGVEVAGTGTVTEGIRRFGRNAASRDVLLITGSHQVVSQVPLEGIEGFGCISASVS